MDEGNQTDEIVIYEAENGIFEVRVQVQEGSVWLTQRQMAGLFDTSTDNVSLHLKNIFADGEMVEEATTEDFSVVRREGQREVRRRLDSGGGRVSRGSKRDPHPPNYEHAGSREPLSAQLATARRHGGW